MQQATTTTKNDHGRAPLPKGTAALGAEVRVVSPVGGRDGWSAVDAGPAPIRWTKSGGGARDGAARAWLRGYLAETLNREDRIVMILHYFEGLNAREIGAVVQATEASIVGRLHELNRDLQDAFEGFRNGRVEGD